jgi:acyl dehydratase
MTEPEVTMTEFHVKVGDSVEFSKTVSESDVYLFAGISGDFAPQHVNEQYMSKSSFGGRIAHGVLLVAFMSTTSSLMIQQHAGHSDDETPVSLGYERIRFTAPVFMGDTVRVVYTIAEIDPERRRSRSKIEVTNQRGETVAVAEHILKWVANR